MFLRLIASLCVLIIAIFFVPLWGQITLFALVILINKYHFFILIPALISDFVYAPTDNISISNFKLTVIVLIMLGVYWLVVSKTRIGVLYENKI